jgi:sugar phosphate isomerase/epimerase
MRLGLSSYTYTWAVGVPGSLPENPMLICGLLEKTISAGVKVVQVADNLPIEKLTEEDLELLVDYSSEKGISLEMGGRGLTADHTMACLKTAEKIGSPILRMVIDGCNYFPPIQDIKGIIKDLVPEFDSRKIRLAIENHDRLKAREFEDIIQSVGSEWVGICLDSVNSMGAGEGFETVSEILAPYTFNLHIKDFTIHRVSHKMGLIIEGCPAGKGMLDIPGLLNLIGSYSQCDSAILELWTPPDDNIEATIKKETRWAEESIEYLKTLI